MCVDSSTNTKRDKNLKERQKKENCVEVCQYQQYALWPELSSQAGSWFSAMAQTTDGHCEQQTEYDILFGRLVVFCGYFCICTMHYYDLGSAAPNAPMFNFSFLLA